jgi:hypothetical protein
MNRFEVEITFPISTCTAKRDLGVRYDTRDNVFDWDYHMRLVGREVILLSKHRGI